MLLGGDAQPGDRVHPDASTVCFLFLLSGFALVLNAFQGWAPQPVIDAIASLSFLTHFGSIAKGVIDVRDLLYFAP